MIEFVVPSVHVVARPLVSQFECFPGEPDLKWDRDPNALPAEHLVEFAGRTCYLSFGEFQHTRSSAKYLSNLIAKGHESVLEHASWTFLIKNIGRAVSQQLTRHRIGWSFSQLSQQYYDRKISVSLPPQLRSPEAEAIVKSLYVAALDAATKLPNLIDDAQYERNLGEPEVRRAIRTTKRLALPEITATHIVASANARALRHFFSVRGGIAGDAEMRELAILIFKSIQPEAPAFFSDFQLVESDLGTGRLCKNAAD